MAPRQKEKPGPRPRRAAARSARPAAAILEELVSAQLVRPAEELDPTFAFKHTLTQEAAYQSLLLKKRSAIHRRVAEAYERFYRERLDDYAGLLAHHFGEAGEDAKTLEYAQRAGDVAARLYAYAEALGHYTQAIAIVGRIGEPHPGCLAELYLHRGRVLELSGQWAEAKANYLEMQDLGLRRGDRAMQLAALMARTTIHAIPTSEYDFDLAQQLSEESLQLARALNDRPSEARILWNRLLMFSRLQMRLVPALAAGEESLRIARELNLEEQVAYTLNDLGTVLMFAGRAERGEDALRESLAYWRKHGNLQMAAGNLGYAAMGHLSLGRFEQAVADSQQARQESEAIGDVWGEAFSQTFIGPGYLELGRPDRARAVMEEAIALARESGFVAPLGVTASDLGRLYAELGWLERGLVKVERVYNHLSGHRDSALIWVVGHLGSLLVRAGQPERAESILAQARSVMPQDDESSRMSILLRLAEGELALARGEPARALELYDRLASTLERLRLLEKLPLALLGKAEAASRLGQTEQARAALLDARAWADQISARWSLWQILAALATLDSDARPEEAREWRRQARALVQEFAAHTPTDLLSGFLDLPTVKRLNVSHD